MHDTIVREVKSTDADAVSRLMGEVGLPVTQQQMRNRLLRIERDPTFRTFVCEHVGQIVGVAGIRIGCSYHSDSVDAHILLLVVSKKFRRKGLGELLVSSAEKWAIRQGATRVILTSQTDEADALEFCRKKNYLQSGHRFTKEFSTPTSRTLFQ